MPKKEIDYSKTIIYKIVCNDLNIKDCYIGSTTSFTKRKNRHKSNCNNKKTEGRRRRACELRRTGTLKKFLIYYFFDKFHYKLSFY